MPALRLPILAVVGLAVSLALSAVGQASAHAYDAGPLHIDRPWIRTPPPGAPTAAGYLTIVNHGRMAERLLGGVSAEVQAIEPHAMSMNGGVMRMRALSGGFAIAPGASLTLAPGGDHLMLVAPRRPLKAGDRVAATLNFAHAGPVKVEFVVQDEAPARGAAAGAVSMPGMDMH
jgi:periplasmic copper chaperone A